MLKIEGKNINVTRGDYLPLTVDADNLVPQEGNERYVFQQGDVVRFKVTERGDVSKVYLQKDFKVTEQTEEVLVELFSEEMKLGELSSEAVVYWYEIELNPDTPKTQTIVGYDLEEGAALLTLLPEGGDYNDKGAE